MALLFFVSLVTWSVSSPVGSSPDEDVHLAALYCAAGRADCSLDVGRPFACFARDSRISGDCVSITDDRMPTAGQFAIDDYPSLYPRVMSGFLGDTVGRSTTNIRLVNSLLAVGLLIASFMTCRRDHRAPVLLGWAAAALPLTMFMVASVNPNAWTVIGVAALWGPLLGMWLEDGLTWERTTVVLVAALMIVGSRTEGVLLIGIVFACVVAYGFRDVRRGKSLVGIALAGAGLVAALVQASREMPTTDGGRPLWQTLIMGAATPFESLGGGHYFPAQLGWLDTPIPPVAAALGLCVFFGLTFVGLGRMDRPKAAALVTFWLLFLGAAGLSWIVKYPIPLQPRYFLPLLTVVAGLALLPTAAGKLPLLTKTQLGLVAVALGIVNALGLLYLCLRFVTGIPGESTVVPGPYYPGPSDLFSAGTPDWWLGYVSPFVTWLIGTLAYTTAMLLVMRYVYMPRSAIPAQEVSDA